MLKTRLDRWFSERSIEKGAMVLPNMKVDALLRGRNQADSGRVISIRAGDDEIGADVVIVAEGVLGLLSTSAGLRTFPKPRHHALGYKEVTELPSR